MTGQHKSRRGYLIVIPWGIHHIGGVNQAVRDLSAQFLKATSLQPLLLVSESGHRKTARRRTGEGLVEYSITITAPTYRDRNLRTLLSYLFRSPATAHKLARLVKRENVAVVNLHYPSLSAMTIVLAVRLFARQTKVILSFHGSDVASIENTNSCEKLMWKIVFAKASFTVTCSDALRSRLMAAMRGIPRNIQVVHNGEDPEELKRLAKIGRLPKELEGRKFVLNVGTREWKKGQDVLLAA